MFDRKSESNVGPDWPVVTVEVGDVEDDGYYVLQLHGFKTVAFSPIDRADAVARMKEAERLSSADYQTHVDEGGYPHDFSYQTVYEYHASLIN